MKGLLLADAYELATDLSKYEAAQDQVENAAYKTFALMNRTEFFNLGFMEADISVWAANQDLVDSLTPYGHSRTVRDVVQRILRLYPYDTPIEVFKHLFVDESWFEECLIMSARFDQRLMGNLLVRPLTPSDKPAHPPPISYYIEDGNRRALVYAVLLMMDAERYRPVRIIFSEDWRHLYPWARSPAEEEAEEAAKAEAEEAAKAEAAATQTEAEMEMDIEAEVDIEVELDIEAEVEVETEVEVAAEAEEEE